MAEVWSRWREQLRADLIAAVASGGLPGGFDVDEALLEMVGAGLALNAAMQLQHDRAAAGRARRVIERALDQS
ncbi:TetR family transcriptional regulator C-terminal domain-containing protein [Amycolatopsis sp. A1MSW2902]|uniref:TetR family transcriptional regulator C-terminal domain-containing protein n=1 Tax=Amycolatopsis sp. A1MSW2902 TaxID=687413 RepID=UPI00307D80C7